MAISNIWVYADLADGAPTSGALESKRPAICWQGLGNRPK